MVESLALVVVPYNHSDSPADRLLVIGDHWRRSSVLDGGKYVEGMVYHGNLTRIGPRFC